MICPHRRRDVAVPCSQCSGVEVTRLAPRRDCDHEILWRLSRPRLGKRHVPQHTLDRIRRAYLSGRRHRGEGRDWTLHVIQRGMR